MMKERSGWICCILLLAVCAFSLLSQNTQADVKDAWEYTAYATYSTQTFDIQQLNNLGSQGWEVVTVMPAADEKNPTRILFKRKK